MSLRLVEDTVHEAMMCDDTVFRGDILEPLSDDNENEDSEKDATDISSPRIANRSLKSIVRHTSSKRPNEGTLISRQWYYVMPIAIISYTILQIILSSQSKVCQQEEPFSHWTYEVGIAVSSCFLLNVCYHVINGLSVESFAQKETQHLRGVYAGAATMSLIGGASTVLYLTQVGDYVCFDALGVETPASQWPEWLVASPLLVYITIAIEDKTELIAEDYTIILLMFLCILFGFIMNFRIDFASGIILYILSSLCMVGNIVMALKASEKTKNQEKSKLLSRQWIVERLIMKTKLARLLFWLLPIFPILYILGKV